MSLDPDQDMGMGMPRRLHSYAPWRNATRRTRAGSFLIGITFGFCAAVAILFVLSNARKRPVTPAPIKAIATAPVPAPETVEPASKTPPSISEEEAAAESTFEQAPSPWSIQLVGDSSETRALEEYRRLQKRFPALLGSRTPVVIKWELGGRGSAFWYQVRLREDSQESARNLCTQLRSAGGQCLVLSD